MVNASLLLFLMSLAQMAANNLRPLLLASQGTLESVADYRIIQGVVSFALMVSGGVLNVVYPEVARLEAQGDTGRLRDFSQRGTSLLLWAHVLLLVPLALSSELILRLYVGAEFTHLTLPLAVWLLTCMAGHNAIFSSVLLSRGRFGLLTASSIFNAALTLWLAYLLIPQHGLNAVVWTYVLFVVLQALVFYGFLIPPLRLGSLRQFALMLFKPVAGAAVATVLSLALAHTVGLPLWTAGLFAALAIVVLSLGFGEVLANLRVLMPARLP
jgi:O-antigen/teichoic acid export membrane protein